MNKQNNSLSVIVPALNEGKNIEKTLSNLIDMFVKHNIDWEIILINDGSTDNTQSVMEKYSLDYKNIKLIIHNKPEGIGGCFKEGVKHASKKGVCWFPSDGENNAEDLVKYLALFEHTDIIVPFALNKGVRSFFRRVLSTLYVIIINISFGTMFNYTNGNVLYKRSIFDGMKINSNGFFFQTECLIKAIRKNNIYCEVPIHLKKRGSGKSKALSLKSAVNVVKDYLNLMYEVHIKMRFQDIHS